MAITVLKIFLGCIAVFMAWNLNRSLSCGAIQFGNSKLGIAADRATDPKAFWLIFGSNTCAIAFFLWLIFR